MDCLIDYIKIEGTTYPPDTGGLYSGLYINKDLPINLKQIDKIADEEQGTFLVVWSEVQKRGVKKFVNRVKAGYKELFNICFLDDEWFCDNKAYLALPLLYYLGTELMIERQYSDRINRYTTIERARARELREEFQGEFYTQLKDALELIGCVAGNDENGEIFTFVEVLP
jgi:hypothetical protein